MDIPHPVDTVLRFVECINRQNLDGLVALMTESHTFIDLAGDIEQGRDHMRAGWDSYFKLCPAYIIYVAEVFQTDEAVILLGRTTGSHLEQPRHVEIADTILWAARLAGGRLAAWELYYDTPENRARLGANEAHRLTR